MPRIITGELRGRRVQVPRVAGLRPTGDRVREALFGIVHDRVPGAVVLDAYAGSGLLGLEAASRGAARVVFIEADRMAVAALRAILAAWKIEDRCQVVAGAVTARAGHGAARGPFDLILADPPWTSAESGPFLARVVESGLLCPGGLLVLERATRAGAPPVRAGALTLERTARYGETSLDFFALAVPG